MASWLLIAGCGESESRSANTVRIANWLHAAVDPGFLALERRLESEFERSHPQYDLHIEPIPGVGQYAPKLILMHAANSIPDAGYLDVASGAIFINNGLVRPIDDFVADDPQFRLDDYFPNVLDSFRRDGKLYGIPLDFTPMVLVYNKKLFDAAGVPYPKDGWTWADFLDTARRLADKPETGKVATRRLAIHFENIMPFWIVWLWNNGGDVLTPDGSRASGALDSPATIDAFEFLLSLMFDHRVMPSLRESAAMGVDLFRAGRAAMDVKGHWMLIDYRAAGLDVGVVSLPTNIGRPATVLYQSGLCVFANGRSPRVGWEWIKFMTSEDVQVRRVASGLAISGNQKAAAHFAGNPLEDAFLRQIPNARTPWGARVERYPFIEELGTEMMRTIINEADLLSRTSGAGKPDPAARRAMIERNLRETAALIDAALR
ncbi:MAG: sugar ABC transporter substrate-binding protein [Planctomycetes bacterium]|nr:sugar ABC transporter substrate-binding protein [Planctomycetota bacterium]